MSLLIWRISGFYLLGLNAWLSIFALQIALLQVVEVVGNECEHLSDECEYLFDECELLFSNYEIIFRCSAKSFSEENTECSFVNLRWKRKRFGAMSKGVQIDLNKCYRCWIVPAIPQIAGANSCGPFRGWATVISKWNRWTIAKK